MPSADLPPDKAARVLAALRGLRDRLGSNAAAAKAIGRSGASVGDLLSSPPKARPSYDTAARVAAAVGLTVDDLLAGATPPAEPDRYPARAAALARLRGLLSPDVEHEVRAGVFAPGDEPQAEREWIELILRAQRRHDEEQRLDARARTLTGRA